MKASILKIDNEASVSVETALVFLFIFVPLLIVSIDALFVMTARQQLNEALQSVEIFAWAQPSSSTDSTAINHLLDVDNPNRVAAVNIVSPPTLSYTCLQSDGTSQPASLSFQPGFSSALLSTPAGSNDLADQQVPSISEPIGGLPPNQAGTATCSSGQVQANVTYSLAEEANIPFPLPGLPSSIDLEVTGTIWIH